MNHSFVIANYIIKKLEGKLNLIKLQSLIYYAQGWNLVINNKPIINEFIRLDSYGIRIDSLYFSLISNYGNKDLILSNSSNYRMLKDLYDDLNLNTQDTFNDFFEFNISKAEKCSSHSIDAESLKVLDKVIDSYGVYSSSKLFNMLQQNPHPFSLYDGKYEDIESTYIDNEELKKCFEVINNLHGNNN